MAKKRCLRMTMVVIGLTALVACETTGGGSGAGPLAVYDVSALPADTEYTTKEPAGPGFVGSEAQVLGRTLVQVNTARGTSLRPDNRLAQLARWVYERLGPEASMPPLAALELITHHLGLTEPPPHLLFLQAPDAPRLAKVVAQSLEGMFDLSDYTHIGGVGEREPDRVTVVVALSMRHLTMAPVPRSMAGPGRLILEGKLSDGYAKPQLAHTRPDGQTQIKELGQGTGFSASLDLAAKGKHQVEILASGRRGPTVLSNFPVYVGVPAKVRVEAAATPRRAPAPADAQVRLLELINQDRAAAGLAPLELDPGLSQVALKHSEDMQKNRFVAHISPTTGSLRERLTAAGIATDIAAEDIGRGYSPEEIHQGLMESPGHRSAILNKDLTHVGIGIVSKREAGRTAYLVTEAFIRRIARLDPVGLNAAFLTELNRSLARNGRPAVEEDPRLSELATHAASEYLNDPKITSQDALNRLQRRLMQDDLKIYNATVVTNVVGSLNEGAAIDRMAGVRAKRVGIGIAQGQKPGLVPNAIVVFLVFVE